MNEKNTRYLVQTYPSLYRPDQYFACGDGWFLIIEELSAELYNESQISGCSCEICDVKEKYGTLRVYTDSSNDKMERMIDKAEALSGKVCEVCGKPGELRGNTWFSTYCDDCMEK